MVFYLRTHAISFHKLMKFAEVLGFVFKIHVFIVQYGYHSPCSVDVDSFPAGE